MAGEPAVKRTVAFFDGQNLYRHAKEAFGHHHPNSDPQKLFGAVCDCLLALNAERAAAETLAGRHPR